MLFQGHNDRFCSALILLFFHIFWGNKLSRFRQFSRNFMPFEISNQQKGECFGIAYQYNLRGLFCFFGWLLEVIQTWMKMTKIGINNSCRKMKLKSARKFQKMLIIYFINFLMYQNLILQLTHHILISIPIPSTSQFSQLTHQFKQISIPILSSKVLLMYLMTFPLAFNLTISLYANQLMY